MQSKHGVQTGQFGEWLTDYLKKSPKYQPCQVYHDHGDKRTNPNVVKIKGLYGEKLHRHNVLAQVDVLVVKPDGSIVLVIEIEERGSSPKKIVGDVITNLMCNRFCVVQGKNRLYFGITPETKLVVSGVIETKGSKVAQLEEVIQPRLREFASPGDGIDRRKVELVFKGDLESTIDALKEMMRTLFF